MENRQRKKSALERFMAWLLSALQGSFIGRFFTSYEKANDKFVKRISRKGRKSKKRLARFIEKNHIVSACCAIFRFLLRVPLRDYGIMMFMTGGVVAVLYPLNENILLVEITFEMFVLGAAVSLCSLPLFFSSRSLAENVLSSRIFSHVLFDFLGIDDEGFRNAAEKGRVSFATFAFIIGAALGVASYFLLPTYTVLLVIGIVLVYCTFRTPEVGAILTVLTIPFVNIFYTCIFAAFTFLCYVIKVLLGKRVFKYEYFDLWVSLTIMVVTLCGINYRDPLSSIYEVLTNLAIMLSYFLFSNLIYSKVWFRRSIVAFTTSSLLVAIIAIGQAILGKIAENVDKLSVIAPPNADISSTLGNAEVLAQFMVIAIPFALVHMLSERKEITKFIGFIVASLFLAALFLADSIFGLTGFVIGALLVFAFFNKKIIYLMVVLAIALPVLYFNLPDNVIDAIQSFGPFNGISISGEFEYFGNTFMEVIKLPFGVGISGTTIKETFGQDFIHSLPLQLLASYGIVGAVMFLIVMIMFIRVVLSYSVRAKNEYRRVNGCAGLCSILGLLSVGVFNYVWLDRRIFLIFVITVALSMAYIKIDREEESIGMDYVDISRSSIDIPLKESASYTRVAQMRYVHAFRMKKRLGKQGKNKSAEAKEFSNTEELFIIKRKLNENGEEQE